MTKEEFARYSPYFKPEEFDSPDKPGSGFNMQKGFMDKLLILRLLINEPLIINSGFRTHKHNKEIGGKPDSSHLKGWAADISANTSDKKYKIINLALKIGFNRIGIGSTFIHLDNDPNKPKNVIWTY